MIDDKTGLPALPDGYFWRVTRGVASRYVYLQMRKKRWLGSKVVDYSIISKSENTAELVLKRARGVVRDFNPDRNHKQFVGNYPPNTLVMETGEEG